MAGRILPAVLLAALLCGCSPRHLVEYRDRVETVHDTTYVAKTDTRTEYVRDSIFVREKGDTVYRYVERWRYRDRYVHDTIVRSRTDTVYLDRTVRVEVPAKLAWWQGLLVRIGALALLALAAFLAWRIIKAIP